MASSTHPQTIHEFLSHIATYGSRLALEIHGEDKGISYGELVTKISLVASNLKNQTGLAVGDRIMLYGLTGPDWVVTFFACLLNGYIVVPIDVRMSTDLANELIGRTGPKIIICQGDVPLRVDLSRPILFSKLTQAEASSSDLDSFERLSGETIAEIIMTSGTWSQPKGVTLTHKNLLSNLAGIDLMYHLADESKMLSILPLAHIYEQMCGLIVPLFRGATIVYLNEIRADILTTALREHQITTVVAVPRILALLRSGILKKLPLSRRASFEKLVLFSRWFPVAVRRRLFAKVHQSIGPQLRTFVISGAPLEQKLDYFFQGLGYITLFGYGLSETSPTLTLSLDQNRIAGCVGRPLANVKITLNQESEVLAKGDNVFYGYWPEKRTGEYLNTGDVGRFDSQGNLILMGRSKNLVIFPSGDKIFLEDIEKIANETDGVEESCAINLGDDHHPKIHLFVVTTEQTADRFLDSVNAKLPFGVRVKSVSKARTETFPRTHTLKLNRKQILDDYAEDIRALQLDHYDSDTNAAGEAQY